MSYAQVKMKKNINRGTNMPRILELKTIKASLIGMIIAMSWMSLPVKATESKLFEESSSFSQKNLDFREPSSSQTRDNSLKNLIGITGLGIGTGIIAWHIAREQKKFPIKYLGDRNKENKSLLEQVSPKLRRELLRLVHDQKTVNRLLYGTKNSHPSRAPNWLAEKVIYDLKRGR